MSTHYQTKEEIMKVALKILNKSIRQIIKNPNDIDVLERKIVQYQNKRKGLLGGLVEEYLFNLDVNNKSEADFSIAGVELKTNPLKNHPTKKYISKERLVFSMINYETIIHESWENSSFLKKNKVVLIMFYLWLKEKSILDYEFKFVYLLNLVKDISEEDAFQIQKDWEYIVTKIKRGEAHLLSEGDTYYLGACTKAANNRVVRDQSGFSVPAKPRAFSFKQQYLNYIIQRDLLGHDTNRDSIFKKVRRIESVEDAFKEVFNPYKGMTDSAIQKSIGCAISKKAKSYKRLLVNKILDVSSNTIPEFEKANITLKVITLEHTGTLKESLSFPAFDYKDLLTQVWYDKDAESMADFHMLLETKKFFFVVFQKNKDTDDIILRKVQFWNFPMQDIEEAHRVWDKTIACIREGQYNNLPKISSSSIVHVRPHGKNANDTIKTPQGTFEVKCSFWLNAKYIQRSLEAHS